MMSYYEMNNRSGSIIIDMDAVRAAAGNQHMQVQYNDSMKAQYIKEDIAETGGEEFEYKETGRSLKLVEWIRKQASGASQYFYKSD